MDKPFWSFGYDSYYPSGGIDDCIGRFATLEEAKAALLADHSDFRSVVDVRLGETVFTLKE